MKLSTIVLLAIASGALACGRDSRPQASNAAAAAPPPARVETATVAEAAPPEPGIPTNTPAVAPPALVVPPDQTPLTPASGVGAPRSGTAALVPTDPTLDQHQTAGDQESIREIRASLAADERLSSTARKVTIVARNGRVWLRGQVNTAAERSAIERFARQAVGVIHVRNELLVME